MASDCKIKDLQTVKQEIRALLISSKHGSTPKQLESAYLQVVGDSVPYHFLGHTNFMNFIYSMPDVVSVCRSRNNITLYGVADSKTRKIKELVSKQRSSKYSDFTSPPRMNQVTSNTRPTPKTPEVPLSFRTCLKELMLSHPNGLALRYFNEAFAKRFHHYIAFRNWGFETLEDVVKSVPDILTIVNDTSRNITMIKRVPPQEKKRREEKSVEVKEKMKQSINWHSLEYERKEMDCGKPQQQQQQQLVDKNHVSRNKSESEEGEYGSRNEKGASKKKENDGVHVSPEAIRDSLHSLELSPHMKKKLIDEIQAPVISFSKKKAIPIKVTNRIKQLLKANVAGIWLSRFLMEYQEFCGDELDVEAMGYSSVAHLLHSIPCCVLEKPGGVGDWLVYLKGTTPPKVSGNNRKSQFRAYVSEELIRAVHKTLKGCSPKGTPLSSFPIKFRDVVDCELPMAEMGFNSTAELLQRIPGVEVMRPPKSDLVMVFSTWNTKEEEKKEDVSTELHGGEEKCNIKTEPSSYKKISLPEPSHTKFLSVYVTEVRNPGSVSIQLIGKETTQALECLQEDMTNFYKSKEGKSYTIEEAYPGQPCCATFNDSYWYRAEVMELVCSDVVRIFYVDYGNISEVPITAVRRPKMNYLVFPAQAIECRLCHLKPAGSTWSLRATQLLQQMTNDIPLVVIVTAIKNRLMSVYLVDTSTSRDLYINDALVNQGLALFESDTPQDEMGLEVYELESAHIEGGDGKSVPHVRMPKDLCTPRSPTTTTQRGQSMLSQHIHPDNHGNGMPHTSFFPPPPPPPPPGLPITSAHSPLYQAPPFPPMVTPFQPMPFQSMTAPFQAPPIQSNATPFQSMIPPNATAFPASSLATASFQAPPLATPHQSHFQYYPMMQEQYQQHQQQQHHQIPQQQQQQHRQIHQQQYHQHHHQQYQQNHQQPPLQQFSAYPLHPQASHVTHFLSTINMEAPGSAQQSSSSEGVFIEDEVRHVVSDNDHLLDGISTPSCSDDERGNEAVYEVTIHDRCGLEELREIKKVILSKMACSGGEETSVLLKSLTDVLKRISMKEDQEGEKCVCPPSIVMTPSVTMTTPSPSIVMTSSSTLSPVGMAPSVTTTTRSPVVLASSSPSVTMTTPSLSVMAPVTMTTDPMIVSPLTTTMTTYECGVETSEDPINTSVTMDTPPVVTGSEVARDVEVYPNPEKGLSKDLCPELVEGKDEDLCPERQSRESCLDLVEGKGETHPEEGQINNLWPDLEERHGDDLCPDLDEEQSKELCPDLEERHGDDLWPDLEERHGDDLCLDLEEEQSKDLCPDLEERHGDDLWPDLDEEQSKELCPDLEERHGDDLCLDLDEEQSKELCPDLEERHGDELCPDLEERHGDDLCPDLEERHGDDLCPDLEEEQSSPDPEEGKNEELWLDPEERKNEEFYSHLEERQIKDLCPDLEDKKGEELCIDPEGQGEELCPDLEDEKGEELCIDPEGQGEELCPDLEDKKGEELCIDPEGQGEELCPDLEDEMGEELCIDPEGQGEELCPDLEDEKGEELCSYPEGQGQELCSYPEGQGQELCPYPEGRGQELCSYPEGQGQELCSYPEGQGQELCPYPEGQDQELCSYPEGQGQELCPYPEGQGQELCSYPEGQGQELYSYPEGQGQELCSYPEGQDQELCTDLVEREDEVLCPDLKKNNDSTFNKDHTDGKEIFKEESAMPPSPQPKWDSIPNGDHANVKGNEEEGVLPSSSPSPTCHSLPIMVTTSPSFAVTSSCVLSPTCTSSVITSKVVSCRYLLPTPCTSHVRSAPVITPCTSHVRSAPVITPYSSHVRSAPVITPYSSHVRPAPVITPYSSHVRPAPVITPYSSRGVAPVITPYSSRGVAPVITPYSSRGVAPPHSHSGSASVMISTPRPSHNGVAPVMIRTPHPSNNGVAPVMISTPHLSHNGVAPVMMISTPCPSHNGVAPVMMVNTPHPSRSPVLTYPRSLLGNPAYAKKRPIGIGRGLSCGRSRRSSEVLMCGHPLGAVRCNRKCLRQEHQDVDNGASSKHMHLL